MRGWEVNPVSGLWGIAVWEGRRLTLFLGSGTMHEGGRLTLFLISVAWPRGGVGG